KHYSGGSFFRLGTGHAHRNGTPDSCHRARVGENWATTIPRRIQRVLSPGRAPPLGRRDNIWPRGRNTYLWHGGGPQQRFLMVSLEPQFWSVLPRGRILIANSLNSLPRLSGQAALKHGINSRKSQLGRMLCSVSSSWRGTISSRKQWRPGILRLLRLISRP